MFYCAITLRAYHCQLTFSKWFVWTANNKLMCMQAMFINKLFLIYVMAFYRNEQCCRICFLIDYYATVPKNLNESLGNHNIHFDSMLCLYCYVLQVQINNCIFLSLAALHLSLSLSHRSPPPSVSLSPSPPPSPILISLLSLSPPPLPLHLHPHPPCSSSAALPLPPLPLSLSVPPPAPLPLLAPTPSPPTPFPHRKLPSCSRYGSSIGHVTQNALSSLPLPLFPSPPSHPLFHSLLSCSRYGSSVGLVTQNALSTVVNIAQTIYNLAAFRPRSLLRRTAKGTGYGLVSELATPAPTPTPPAANDDGKREGGTNGLPHPAGDGLGERPGNRSDVGGASGGPSSPQRPPTFNPNA